MNLDIWLLCTWSTPAPPSLPRNETSSQALNCQQSSHSHFVSKTNLFFCSKTGSTHRVAFNTVEVLLALEGDSTLLRTNLHYAEFYWSVHLDTRHSWEQNKQDVKILCTLQTKHKISIFYSSVLHLTDKAGNMPTLVKGLHSLVCYWPKAFSVFLWSFKWFLFIIWFYWQSLYDFSLSFAVLWFLLIGSLLNGFFSSFWHCELTLGIQHTSCKPVLWSMACSVAWNLIGFICWVDWYLIRFIH